MKLYRITAMLLNYYYFSINSLDRVFDVLYWPLLDIFIWGFMTYFIQGISEVNILNLILGGLVLWVFIWRASQDLVVYLMESYWSRSTYHLFTTPIKISEFVISLCLLGLIRSVLAFGVMSLLSFGLWRFSIFNFNLLHFALLVAILVLFGWGIGILISSCIFRFGTRIQVLAWSTIWIVQPFSCVFYPLEALPKWAAKIAVILPTTHVFEQLRASMNGLPLDYGSLLYSFVFVIVFLVLAALILVKSIRGAKKAGTFAKPE
ncbi:MAG TPA: ABC transporter permease [Candidatus Nanoarchaeia archaeon]|nr:ABC transporter permease [Candidatus Nanoarchaeia archaeon]